MTKKNKTTPAVEFKPSQLIGIDSIQESKTNPRKHWDEKALKELAESIKQHGVHFTFGKSINKFIPKF